MPQGKTQKNTIGKKFWWKWLGYYIFFNCQWNSALSKRFIGFRDEVPHVTTMEVSEYKQICGMNLNEVWNFLILLININAKAETSMLSSEYIFCCKLVPGVH